MKKEHIFLILNYNTTKLTCDLALNIIKSKYRVVIVDNNSIFSHIKELEEFCTNYDLIDIIKLEENYGFAIGNNYGYTYIKEQYDADFIHCINSDILIEDIDNFINRINEVDSSISVIGPNVIHNGYRTSPMYIRDSNTINNDVLNEISNYKKKILKHKVAKVIKPIYYKYMDNKDSFIQKEDFNCYKESLTDNKYYVLNGCYLIFSKNYINKYDYLFNKATFLYYEEDFLFYRLFKDDMRVKYVDDIKIEHLEGVSSSKNIVRKYQLLLESLEKFNDFIRSYNEN